jgi:hypothetical protein
LSVLAGKFGTVVKHFLLLSSQSNHSIKILPPYKIGTHCVHVPSVLIVCSIQLEFLAWQKIPCYTKQIITIEWFTKIILSESSTIFTYLKTLFGSSLAICKCSAPVLLWRSFTETKYSSGTGTTYWKYIPASIYKQQTIQPTRILVTKI